MTINDRIFGILILVVAVAYGWTATQFPEPFGGSEAVDSGTFPIVIAVVMALSSLYLIVRPDPDNHWPATRTALELLLAVVVLIAYTLLLQPLGFILATLLAIGTLCWRMGAPPLRAYIVGAVSGVVVYLLFTLALGLALPTGVLDVLEGL
ncbi:tripartite tricarboxylate transporter TctB family protein [Kushneria aurantia]|uniref:Tripartite tricarboxylate transporter TctB family protein n=1 Tax=Kushneria aurantia TaxID=504092 RepID=A0ABV6FZF9_9GAMM|nr:tripartite tricarboxylate transporter TctB family protein [Kushneria aurantia]